MQLLSESWLRHICSLHERAVVSISHCICTDLDSRTLLYTCKEAKCYWVAWHYVIPDHPHDLNFSPLASDRVEQDLTSSPVFCLCPNFDHLWVTPQVRSKRQSEHTTYRRDVHCAPKSKSSTHWKKLCRVWARHGSSPVFACEGHDIDSRFSVLILLRLSNTYAVYYFQALDELVDLLDSRFNYIAYRRDYANGEGIFKIPIMYVIRCVNKSGNFL